VHGKENLAFCPRKNRGNFAKKKSEWEMKGGLAMQTPFKKGDRVEEPWGDLLFAWKKTACLTSRKKGGGACATERRSAWEVPNLRPLKRDRIKKNFR